MKPEHLALLVPLQEAQLDAPQRDVAVTVLRQGMSRNGRYFTPQALQDVAQQIDGLKAFADHPSPAGDSIHKPRSVRDVVGFYREPRLEGDRVRATLHIFSSADWLWSLVQEAVELGRPDVLGLSIDSLASVRTQQQNGKSIASSGTHPGAALLRRGHAGRGRRRVRARLGSARDFQHIQGERYARRPTYRHSKRRAPCRGGVDRFTTYRGGTHGRYCHDDGRCPSRRGRRRNSPA